MAVVRAAGVLDRATAPALLRLLDVIIHRSPIRLSSAPTPSDPTDASTATRLCGFHVLVDLSGIRLFGHGGLDALKHADLAARQVHLTGLTARAGLLPGWVTHLIAQFSNLGDLDDSIETLSGSGAPVAVRTLTCRDEEPQGRRGVALEPASAISSVV